MRQDYIVHYNKNLNKDQSVPYTINVEEVGECPMCHCATSPTYIDGFMVASKDNNIPVTVFLTLYCPRCHNLYIAKYISKHGGAARLELDFVFPRQANMQIFSEEIDNLSPEFVSLYNQALEAESKIETQGLAGLGFRKSIEFLIKDYLIKSKHQDNETIKKLDLGKCIDKLDKDLKDIARASVWLANDETHYFRKNPEYDTEDLKLFIECLVSEINMHLMKEKAKNLIKSKYK